MQLFDTAAGTLRDFSPTGHVSLYVCGITPYDAAHLGHAFTYHVFDVLTRRLRADGQAVRSVRNVTDVDDDIFRVSRERRVDPHVLVAEQVARFDADMASIDILPVDAAPLASAHVPEMVSWVNRLEEDGFAYAVDGWVYFDVTRFPRYGALCGLGEAEMVALSRERGGDPDDPRKRHPLDFVLWQPSLADEDWPSFWGKGRPGWHIECSVLASHFLGTPVDIHGGGNDLIYPHHESEVAQSEAHGAVPFSRLWMHVAMVELDGVKMSKSLGNLIFVRDLLQTVPAGTVRLMLANHHWRSSWSYSVDDLRRADARFGSYLDAVESGGLLDPDEARDYERRFFACLDDDLDTAGALEVLDIAEVAINHSGRIAPLRDGTDGAALLRRLLDVLGCSLVGHRSGAAG